MKPLREPQTAIRTMGDGVDELMRISDSKSGKNDAF
jgi:hypothetical protein